MFETTNGLACFETCDEATVMVYLADADFLDDVKYDLKRLAKFLKQKNDNKYFIRIEFESKTNKKTGKVIAPGTLIFQEIFSAQSEALKEFWKVVADVKDSFTASRLSSFMEKGESSLHICINDMESPLYKMIEITYSTYDSVIISFAPDPIIPHLTKEERIKRLRPL